MRDRVGRVGEVEGVARRLGVVTGEGVATSGEAVAVSDHLAPAVSGIQRVARARRRGHSAGSSVHRKRHPSQAAIPGGATCDQAKSDTVVAVGTARKGHSRLQISASAAASCRRPRRPALTSEPRHGSTTANQPHRVLIYVVWA